jgi:hypothetical protein
VPLFPVREPTRTPPWLNEWPPATARIDRSSKNGFQASLDERVVKLFSEILTSSKERSWPVRWAPYVTVILWRRCATYDPTRSEAIARHRAFAKKYRTREEKAETFSAYAGGLFGYNRVICWTVSRKVAPRRALRYENLHTIVSVSNHHG